MPKQFAKAVEARERKESAKQDARSKQEKEKEDAYWASAGEGAKSKAAAKRDEQEKQRQEAAAKRAEAKRLADEEMEALSRPKSSKTVHKPTSKVTHHQLAQQREFEERLREEQAAEALAEKRREMSEETYSRMVEIENVNRAAGTLQGASSVTEALAVLGLKDEEAEKHPEKRMKAAWAAYQERQLPLLKEEKPGLKLMQYKDLMWKAWQKSPENPMVQAAAVGR